MPLPKPAPGTLKWWVVGVLGVGAMVGWVVWYGIASTVGAISPQVTGYQVSSDSAVRVDYALIRPADTAVSCVVVALDERKGRAGAVTDEIPAGATHVQRTVEIRTSHRAVTGIVESCVRR